VTSSSEVGTPDVFNGKNAWDAEDSLRPTLECPHCGLVQFCGAHKPRMKITCCRCHSVLAHCTAKSLDVTLACTGSLLLLFVPALFESFLTTSAFGATRTSVLPMSAGDLWSDAWPLLALVVLLFVMVFPLVRFGSLTAVLLTLRLGHRPFWLGPVFRLANTLQTWAMLDVFLLGFAVAYARLHASLLVTLDIGAYCFVAAALLGLIARATLDKARVWQLIKPDRYHGHGGTAIACQSCDYWVPREREGDRCPRCSAIVTHRRPDSVMRSTAFLAAAVLLYFPANLYPIATIPIDLTPTAYTVLGGVFDLAKSHLLGLALLVFCASFTIPLLKMIGLSWCIASTLIRSDRHLIVKTRVFRLIEEIGRWSMVDPLTIACFVPVLHFNGLINGRAEPAATPFAAVVVLTTLASKFFDSRLMWDAAKRRS
jgi:paraquat-inducible protein A